MDDTLVFDVETKKSFAEVGGEEYKRDLGVSVLGVYSYAKDAFFSFEEHELAEFEKLLQAATRVVGFNVNHFDIPVLEPYLSAGAFAHAAVTDIFEDAVNFLGHRVGLGGVAKATLGESKSGNGLDALQWFREGRIEEVKKYCADDVRLTRDLYEYGKRNGHILFESYIDGKTHSIPVSWEEKVARPLREVIEDALATRRRLAIEYVSSENSDGLGFRKSRLVDVYRIKPNGEVEAYCHLRGGVRSFRMNRILKAEATGDTYTLPQDFQKVLF